MKQTSLVARLSAIVLVINAFALPTAGAATATGANTQAASGAVDQAAAAAPQINNGPPGASNAAPTQPVSAGAGQGPAQYSGYPQGGSGYPPNAVATGGAPLPSPLVPPDPVAQAITELAPLNPKQVRQIRDEVRSRDQAMYPDAKSLPQARTRVIHIDLSPGAPPPTIYISPDLGGTVAFVDMAGNAWPIEHADNFGSKGYSISTMSENVLSVWCTSGYVTGNIAVALKGLPLPVTFTVAPATKEADFRSDMIVPRVLPDKRDAFLGSGARDAIAGYSDDLTQFLLRTPPSSAKQLRVSGAPDTDAWQASDGSLIVRTSAFVRSPAWRRSTSAADGTHVYQLQITPLVTIAGADGRLSYIQISGYDTVSKVPSLSPIDGSAQ